MKLSKFAVVVVSVVAFAVVDFVDFLIVVELVGWWCVVVGFP